MHILVVADGRSPNAQNWIRTLKALDHRVTLISTYPCDFVEGVDALVVMPIAFARASGSQAGQKRSGKKGLVARFRPFFQAMRYTLAPMTLPAAGRKFANLVRQIRPDVVHALRVPFEGMLAAYTPSAFPLIVSTWGNDLTLHAQATARMTQLTQKALQRADALIVDCRRDLRLANAWGFDASKPSLVAAGNGGLDLAGMDAAAAATPKAEPLQILNPRGMRSYVRNDTFFQSIPLVLGKHPGVQFVCPSMQGQPEAEAWVESLHIEKNVTLLPYLDAGQLEQEFARSTIALSVTTHDGTPITLLEAMAFGVLPVCGDIEAIREWITPGVNGLLADPTDFRALADAVNLAIENEALRKRAAEINRGILMERAEGGKVRYEIDMFYRKVVFQQAG